MELIQNYFVNKVNNRFLISMLEFKNIIFFTHGGGQWNFEIVRKNYFFSHVSGESKWEVLVNSIQDFYRRRYNLHTSFLTFKPFFQILIQNPLPLSSSLTCTPAERSKASGARGSPIFSESRMNAESDFFFVMINNGGGRIEKWRMKASFL